MCSGYLCLLTGQLIVLGFHHPTETGRQSSVLMTFQKDSEQVLGKDIPGFSRYIELSKV